MSGNSEHPAKEAGHPDLVDAFIIFLLATAIDIFLFTIATQFVARPVFSSLPQFMTSTYTSIWTSLVTGGAGIGLVIVKSLGAKKRVHPDYLRAIGFTASGLLVGIFLIVGISLFLNRVELQRPPAGATLVDFESTLNSRRTFEFVPIPGTNLDYKIQGTYYVADKKLKGEVTSAKLSTDTNYASPLPQTLSKLFVSVCYLHFSDGRDEMQIRPWPSKSANSRDIHVELKKNISATFASFPFEIDLPEGAEAGRTWLCGGATFSGGYIPFH
ncbi:hypothetical protein ACNHKD_04355 [Methylocystis sp. JAN1]|uniref:hypothetical protein n=1 Tax=Methylocystis sp. JAN1 TaxID=3397211 RepID=UPI003FA1F63D